jgi:sarcosine oxidase, subunit gamma
MHSGTQVRSALAAVGTQLPHFHVGSRVVLRVSEIAHRGVLELARSRKGAALDPVLAAFGIEQLPPTGASASASGSLLLGIGPQLWLLIASDGVSPEFAQGKLEVAFDVAVDVADAWTQFAIVGSASRDLLAKGCALDLHPRVFRQGCCAITRFAQLRCVLHHNGVGYRLLVGRSYAVSLAEWLIEAAAEFGLGLEVKPPAEAASNQMHAYAQSA